MDNKNINRKAQEADNNGKDGSIVELITSKSGLKFITLGLLVILLILSVGSSNEPKKNSTLTLVNPSPPVVQGLYIGMSVDDATKLIDNGLKKHFFLSDEFMYSLFAIDSNAYNDAAILRENIKFIKQKDGTYKFGGPFSFGYKSSNLRSGYTSVYAIIPKNSKLDSKKQSFGTGITIKADSNRTVNSIIFKPIFIKSAFNLADMDNEDFISKFVKQHSLDTLKQNINGAFTGDSSMSYTHLGKNGFRVTIDDDLTIIMQRITSERS
ncbi:MAG: hypothetical protein HQL68_06910 [Magnetococcales bacterium]|nr:hypothetical protein [Magnetococcales bacterium]